MKTRPRAAVAELRPRPATIRTELADDASPAVTLTRGQLKALVRDAVTDALAAASPAAAPASKLLSVSELAQRLGVSRSKANSLRLEGAPAVKLGSVYRFDAEAVLAWLRARGDAP